MLGHMIYAWQFGFALRPSRRTANHTNGHSAAELAAFERAWRRQPSFGYTRR